MKPLQPEPHTTYQNNAQSNKAYASPRLQLDDFQPLNLKGSLSARAGITHLPEVNSIYNSPTTTRSKPVNPLCGEELNYREKYYHKLENDDGFRKRPGYFTDFSNKNNLVTDQLRVDKSPMSNHSRYTSKPVFFTTLQSKNKLSEFISADHSELLEVTKRESINSSKFLNTSGYRDDSINMASDRKANKSTTSTILPALPMKKNTSERNKSQFLPKFYDHSPQKSKREVTWSTKREDDSYAISGNNFTSMNSLRIRSKPHTESVDFGKSNKSPVQKTQVTLDKLKSLQNLQESMRFNTKEATDALTTQFTQRTEDDTNTYIEHKGNLDYMRGSRIAVLKMDEDRKFLKEHPGSPRAYLANVKKESYKELATNQEIDNFEENLQRWMKSVPNFGKQRWTYEKDWEFKIV